MEDRCGHRKRLREKYSRNGHDTLLDYEKIELLLTYALPRVDVKPLAKELLKRFGGLAGLLDAPREELTAFPGIGEVAANLIVLVRNLGADFLEERIMHKDILTCSADVIRFVRMRLSGLRKEAFLGIYLNTRNEVIDAGILGEGTVDQVFIHIRELLTEVLKRGAKGIILIHNHPGGSVEPSAEDIRLTETAKSACAGVMIDLLDHIIVTHDAAYSISMRQRIELGEEEKYSVPPDAKLAAQVPSDPYVPLPFHCKTVRGKMSELTRPRSGKGGGK